MATATLLAIALVFGGSTYQRSWPDAIVQLASLPVLLLALFRLPRGWREQRAAIPLLIVGAIVAVPLLQLVPLSPSIWSRMPGRDLIANGFRDADFPLPWFPISLSPPETWRSALSLLPPIAIFLATLSLDLYARRVISLLLIAFGFLSVLVGLAQIAGGPEGPFRVYGEATTAVGFFLNRNHYAALLYSIIPFAAAWVVGLAADRRPGMVVGVVLMVIVFASLMLGLGMAQSRAGVVFAILAALASIALARPGGTFKTEAKGRKFVILATSIGALLIFQFGLIGILQRLDADPRADDRWEIAETTLRAAKDYFPFGAGLGTFDSIYDIYETPEMLVPTYVNNAHNDYLELLLDAGLFSCVLLTIFLGWFSLNTIRVWGQPRIPMSALDLSLSRAGTICVCLLLLHSWVDYPLRSAALGGVFAFACGLMLPYWGRQRQLASSSQRDSVLSLSSQSSARGGRGQRTRRSSV